MSTAQKKILNYIPKKVQKAHVPARINSDVIKRAQSTATKLGVPFCDFVEGAINMACDQVGK